MSEVRESEFRGRPVLVIQNGPDDRYPFTFGLKKAGLILEHIEDIKQFVAKHKESAPGKE